MTTIPGPTIPGPTVARSTVPRPTIPRSTMAAVAGAPATLPACPAWCEDEEHWLEFGSRKHEVGVGALDLPHRGNPENRVTVACHIVAFDFVEGDTVVSDPPAVVFIEYGGLPRSILRCESPEEAEALARLATEAARCLREIQAGQRHTAGQPAPALTAT